MKKTFFFLAGAFLLAVQCSPKPEGGAMAERSKRGNPGKAIVEDTFTFVCRNLPEVHFQFPVFRGWEPKATNEITGNGCDVLLRWPDFVRYETARMVSVTRIGESEPVGDIRSRIRKGDFLLGRVRCFPVKENPFEVPFGFAFDPGLYVEGYRPPQGHWDYLQFYGDRFVIRIRIDGGEEEHGFSRRLFVQRVVETFRFQKEPLQEEIVYRYGDASVPPRFHRSYEITVSENRVEVVVESYADVLACREYPLEKEQFLGVLESLIGKGIRRVQLGADRGCTGGTSESITHTRGGRELLSGRVYHCGGKDFGDLGGDVQGFAREVRKLVPDLDELLSR